MIPANVSAAFANQSQSCTELGSPFMGQLMGLCAAREWPNCPVTDRIFQWKGDLSPRSQSVPLRLAGALHAVRLNGDAVLDAVYPPHAVPDGILWQAVSQTLCDQSPTIMAWLDSPPQTNEVRRSAVLIAVGHLLTDRFGLPIRTSELGASAGLNLQWDRYTLEVNGQRFGHDTPVLTLRPDWTGPLPPKTQPNVINRAGVDLNPLKPQSDALRLQAYLWPDQPERLRLTQAAIAAAQTPVDQSDAIDWLRSRLHHKPGELHLIYSTIAWQYFPADKQAEGTAVIANAGEAATDDTPLAWFGMEADDQSPGAALTLRLWPGDLTIPLGRADFHGRWVHWAAP
ncbi:DUF2332 family protein [Yoonia maritima]|uniref:DUF2332 family protein n=1 Tax=Yoonia maritima TaxID=1435347 RepID=UPI000D0E9697